MGEKKPYFDKSVTDVLKGVSLIMMFIHHFFTFPSWWVEGVSYPTLAALAPYFSRPFKMCVAVFCFLTGYFYWFHPRKDLRYSLRKSTDVLLSYWLVYGILAAAGFFAGMRYSPKDVALELFALSLPTMTFCWYVYFYCLVMLLLPWLTRLLASRLGKNPAFGCLFSFVFVPLFLRGAEGFVPVEKAREILDILAIWLPVVLSGVLCAQWEVFERWDGWRARFSFRWGERKKGGAPQRRGGENGGPAEVCSVEEPSSGEKGAIPAGAMLLWLWLAVVAAMGRYAEPTVEFAFRGSPVSFLRLSCSVTLDVLYAPVFVYALVHEIRLFRGRGFFLKPVDYVLSAVGRQSLLMWFFSCLFFNQSKAVFQPILYAPGNPVLVLLWGTALCYGASAALQILLKRLLGLKNRLLFSEKGRRQEKNAASRG